MPRKPAKAKGTRAGKKKRRHFPDDATYRHLLDVAISAETYCAILDQFTYQRLHGAVEAYRAHKKASRK